VGFVPASDLLYKTIGTSSGAEDSEAAAFPTNVARTEAVATFTEVLEDEVAMLVNQATVFEIQMCASACKTRC
jgi:hypothetical protein